MQDRSFSTSDLLRLFTLPQKFDSLEQTIKDLVREREADRQQILHLEGQVCDKKRRIHRLQENQHLRREREIDREFWESQLEQIEFMPALDPEGEIRSAADFLARCDEACVY